MLSEGAGIREEGGTSHMNVHYVNIFIKCEVKIHYSDGVFMA